MLVIEDNPGKISTELEEASCPNHCDNDIPLVFQLFQYDNSKTGSFSVTQEMIHDSSGFR